MASLFDQFETAFQSVFDAALGDAIRVLPRVLNQYTGSVEDPDRPARDTRAVVSFGIGSDIIEGVRRGTDLRGTTTFSSKTAEAWMTAEAYAALGYELQKGDALTHNAALFAVIDVKPDAGGFRMMLTREAT